MFRKQGEFWTIAYAGETCHLRDSKGMAYLAALLQRPRQEFRATMLRALANAAAADGDALDNDPVAAERARVTVSRAISGVLRKLAEHHPPLAAHLRNTVRTGLLCRYAPDPRHPISWTV